MISVLIIWLDILITTVPFGLVFLGYTVNKKDRELLVFEDILIFGIMLVSVYAQFFSLFGGVGLFAHILLYIIDFILIIFILKKQVISDFFRSFIIQYKSAFLINSLVLTVLVLIMSYGASRGYMHYDSDLYHAQSIRWIEEYGVVKGLGNIHSRLAYNSSSFALSALYSFSFISGRSYHSCAGFIALILTINIFRIVRVFMEKSFRVSDFARLGALYYVMNIYDEMVSPASDYFAMMIFVYIILRLLDIYESGSADIVASFTVLSVFLATVKFSACGCIVIAFFSIFVYIKNKEFKKIAGFSALSMITALPYFIRNYFISGWLLYPSTFPDIFSPEWKIPRIFTVSDKAYIIACGRGYILLEGASMSISEWFPHWFSGLSGSEKMFVLLSFISIIIFVAGLFINHNKGLLHLIEGTVVLSFLMWLFSSPLARYGQGIFLILPFTVFGSLYLFIAGLLKIHAKLNRSLNVLLISAILLFLAYKSIFLIRYIGSSYYKDCYIYQLDYGKYDMLPYEIGGLTFYAPDGGDLCGYDPFPATPIIESRFYALGDDYGDGFASTVK